MLELVDSMRLRMDFSDTAIIIPAYKEAGMIKKVIDGLKEFPHVICVNDGSPDKTLEEIQKTKAIGLSHLTNIGQGGALETGIKYALTLSQIKYFVTFDADGQHNIEDVKNMIQEIRRGKCDIILGSRFLKKTSNIPFIKKIVLKLAIIFTNTYTGLKLTDTHNGLRVFNRKFAEKFKLTDFGMAHASEILDIIKNENFRYQEMPVTIAYTDYSRAKGQSVLNGVNILFDLLIRRK